MRGLVVLAMLLRAGMGWSGLRGEALGGHSAVTTVLLRVRDWVAEMPDPESLLLMGTMLCCGAGLCVYRAARAKRAGAKDIRFSVGSVSAGTGF